MLDYVDLIYDFKEKHGLQERAVIVGGGSYGGMLAAWLRMKYPHVFAGALAASAPVLSFEGYIDPDAFYAKTTQDYADADPACPGMMTSGFDALQAMQDEASTYETMAEIFNLCKVPENSSDVWLLINTLESALTSMAMVDYPYPSDFLNPLPAWPVDYSCN